MTGWAQINDEAFEYHTRLARLRQAILEDISKPWTLADAAAVVNLEPTYFSKFFRCTVGLTYTSWLRRVRVQRATQLLRRQNLPITQVAFEVGYGSLRAFQRAFRTEMKMTAQQFKIEARPY